MSKVGVDYGGIYTAGLPVMQDQDKLRERRNKALEKFKGLGLSQLVLSIVAMAVGAATLAVAAKDPMGFPVFNPGPAVAGVVTLIAAGLILLAWYQGKNHSSSADDTPCCIKCLIIGHYTVCLTFLMLCIAALAFCILSAVTCFRKTTVTAKYCFPDKDINIALAIIGAVICVAIAVTCIIALVFFCRYARAFGFKSRGEKVLEYHTAVMMRAMQENQTGQYRGQPVHGNQGYYGGH